MTDTGTDIRCVDDLDPTFAIVTGERAIAQALARRLTTPRGGLFYDGEYGFDLRRYANSDFDASVAFRVSAAVEAECRKDERVADATADTTYDAATETMRVVVACLGRDGSRPRLTLSVDDVTVTILGAA